MYPEQLCTPMRLELTSAGYKELKTSEEVTNLMSQEGTVLLMVNSVSGCAAGNAILKIIRNFGKNGYFPIPRK